MTSPLTMVALQDARSMIERERSEVGPAQAAKLDEACGLVLEVENELSDAERGEAGGA